MKKRIFLNMCAIAIISVIITVAATVFAVYEGSRNDVKSQLAIEADYIKAAYESLGVKYLDELNRNIGGRLTVISADGSVTYDSIANVKELENHSDREEFEEAVKNGTGYAVRESESVNQETCYYAVLLDSGEIIRVAITVSTITSALFALLPWVIGIIILASLIAVLLANFGTKWIVKPINRINLDFPKENEIYEELAPLLVRMEKQRQEITLHIGELNRKQKEFAAITENMSEGLIIIDNKGDVLSCNKSAMRLCGFSGIITKGSGIYVMNRNVDFSSAVDRALSGKRAEHRQLIGGLSCRFFINPVEFEVGGVSGAVVIIMDVTEKENREDLRREFTANVSHELKTPLTSISGYAEIIKNGIAKDKDIKGFADKIYDETQRLITLVADIIKLSRLDEAEGFLQKEKCDLEKIVLDTAARLENQAKQKGVNVLVETESVVVNGVPSLLTEMVANLCDNGVKYNKDGGTLKVTVKARQNGAVLTVEDNGIGIPEEDHDRIFERFYRVDKSHSKETGGTGLGLSIVKHCVLLHGGEISLESKPGKGTKITVVI